MARFELEMDESTRLALQRLANVNDRSMAATIRVLIRKEAINSGVWTPLQVAPKLVQSSRKKPVGGP